MSIYIRLSLTIATALVFLAAQMRSYGGSATWGTNALTGDWNAAANWMPNTVPNGPSDVATFGTSNITKVSINTTAVEVNSIVFNSGAAAFMMAVDATNLQLTGTGIVNNSGSVQSFLTPLGNNYGAIFWFSNATAGQMTTFGGAGGLFVFYDSASAGSATFDVTSGGIFQAAMDFWDNTTAGNATITANNFAQVNLNGNATGASAVFTVTTGAFVIFASNSTADNAVATCIGGNGVYGSSIHFHEIATAAHGQLTAVGATTIGEAGGFIEFKDSTTAANATITVNGGSGGGEGGTLFFNGRSQGGAARVALFGNGKLDIAGHGRGLVTIGSLEGEGLVFLGARALAVGSNNLSTTFSGLIQDTGSFTKTGTGTLTLSGASTYTGGTTVSAGALKVSNNSGSGTGTGGVNVNAGTLGGSGIIAGATTVGTGSGTGAFLAPAVGSTTQATLTIQSALTFNSDATYACTFRAKRNMATIDKAIANGVTINSGATIALSGQTRGRLTTGLTLTVISNTSANPISGTFSNLPNGGIVTINGNHFQASYSGGDGNDLTLTVVP